MCLSFVRTQITLWINLKSRNDKSVGAVGAPLLNILACTNSFGITCPYNRFDALSVVLFKILNKYAVLLHSVGGLFACKSCNYSNIPHPL